MQPPIHRTALVVATMVLSSSHAAAPQASPPQVQMADVKVVITGLAAMVPVSSGVAALLVEDDKHDPILYLSRGSCKPKTAALCGSTGMWSVANIDLRLLSSPVESSPSKCADLPNIGRGLNRRPLESCGQDLVGDSCRLNARFRSEYGKATICHEAHVAAGDYRRLQYAMTLPHQRGLPAPWMDKTRGDAVELVLENAEYVRLEYRQLYSTDDPKYLSLYPEGGKITLVLVHEPEFTCPTEPTNPPHLTEPTNPPHPEAISHFPLLRTLSEGNQYDTRHPFYHSRLTEGSKGSCEDELISVDHSLCKDCAPPKFCPFNRPHFPEACALGEFSASY